MRCQLAPEAISLVQNAVYRKQQRERDQERIKKWDYQLKLLEELTQISGQTRPPTQLPTPPATRSETPVSKNIPTLSELNDTNYRKQCVGYVYYRHKMYKGEPDTEPRLFEWYNWTDYRFTTVHPLPCRVPEWEFGDECKKVRFCTGKMERIK
jgi:hypothetical protein